MTHDRPMLVLFLNSLPPPANRGADSGHSDPPSDPPPLQALPSESLALGDQRSSLTPPPPATGMPAQWELLACLRAPGWLPWQPPDISGLGFCPHRLQLERLRSESNGSRRRLHGREDGEQSREVNSRSHPSQGSRADRVWGNYSPIRLPSSRQLGKVINSPSALILKIKWEEGPFCRISAQTAGGSECQSV